MPRLLRPVVLLAVVCLVLGAFAGPAGAKTGRVHTTKFSVTLTSPDKSLHQVGAAGVITYGWNHLTGNATSDSGPIGVDLQASVQYTNGEGPFFGFVTLSFASLSDVAFRMDGRTTTRRDGVSHFSAEMKAFGGTAALTTVKGGGSFTGTRSDALGGTVQLTFTIRLSYEGS